MVKKRYFSKVRQTPADRILSTDGSYRTDSRRLVGILLGLALVVSVIAVVCYLLPNRADRESRLKRELAEHLTAANYEGAMKCLAALRKITPDSSELQFQHAIVEQVCGNETVASEIIQSLIDKRNPQAALWELDKNFDEGDSQWSDDEQARFEELLAIASSAHDAKSRLRAKRRWIANRIQLGALEEGLVALEEISQEDTASYLHAASIAKQLGLTQRAQGLANIAKLHFTSQLSTRSADDECRLNLARVHLLLDQEADALALLSEGFGLTRQPKFQQAAGEALICWANRLKALSANDQTAIARSTLVHRATQCAPSDQAVLSGVVSLLADFSARSEHFKVRLQETIAAGHDPEAGHFMLGLLSLVGNEAADAKLHLDLAEKTGSHVATVLNNLALTALEDNRLSTEQALLLASEAIERIPTEPRFRETRSRFLLRQGRYQAAIDDLLAALEVPELEPLVRENLAAAYQALGDEDSAREYRALAIP